LGAGPHGADGFGISTVRAASRQALLLIVGRPFINSYHGIQRVESQREHVGDHDDPEHGGLGYF
jgi:hypothetical protein